MLAVDYGIMVRLPASHLGALPQPCLGVPPQVSSDRVMEGRERGGEDGDMHLMVQGRGRGGEDGDMHVMEGRGRGGEDGGIHVMEGRGRGGEDGDMHVMEGRGRGGEDGDIRVFSFCRLYLVS